MLKNLKKWCKYAAFTALQSICTFLAFGKIHSSFRIQYLALGDAFMSIVPVGAEICAQRGYNVHVDALLRTKIEKCNVVSMSSSIGSAYFVLLRFVFKKDRLQLLLCDH